MLNCFVKIHQENTAKVVKLHMASGQEYTFALSSYKMTLSQNNDLVVFTNNAHSVIIDPKQIEAVVIS